MNAHRIMLRVVPLIVALALLAAGTGLWWPGSGEPYPLTTFRGEQVLINHHGLYRYDTVSSATQMQANDLITLTIALPLLVLAALATARGSLRGHLVLTGTLGYLLYTYMSMSIGAAYNQLFLVYVALWALSLWAFALSLVTLDVAALPQRFNAHVPRRSMIALCFGAGGFLLLAWLGRIVAAQRAGTLPPLENTTSLFIQAMDLALIVPLAFVGGWLLLRQRAWGYVLASVFVIKMVTLGLAVSAMAVMLARTGMPISVVELTVFPALTMINLIVAALLLRSVTSKRLPSPSELRAA